MTKENSVSGVNAVASQSTSSATGTAPTSSLAHLSANKRPRADTNATVHKKRQKVTQGRTVATTAALNTLASGWQAKADTAASLRLKLASEAGNGLEVLTEVWNTIRSADSRPALNAAQIALVPTNEDLLLFFRALFTSPLTWEPSQFSAVVIQQQEPVEIASIKAQYYVRRFKFAGRVELADLLEKVRVRAPQYGGQIDLLLAVSSSVVLGNVFVSYGGYTVANSPVGRDLDDRSASDAESGSFLTAFLELYEGKIEVYEVLPLAFTIGSGERDSIKKSRSDRRTAMFEGLVIDSFGFTSLNTAAAGASIECAITTGIQKAKNVLPARRFKPGPRAAFSWQSSESS